MAGTSQGGLLARDKNIAREPGFYARIGRIGGKNGHGGGFASMPKEFVREAGRAGGRKSRRTKKVNQE